MKYPPLSKKYTVLIIDDEEVCLSTMELVLLNTEYEMVAVNNGLLGLEYLQTNSTAVDIIMLDLMLPDIYGLDILQEIRANPATSKIPVILQTGKSDSTDIKKACAMGRVTYLEKPYTKNMIIQELSRIIQEIVVTD